MFLNMTHGSWMESPSGSGRAGIRIRDFTLPGRELRLASALELDSLVGLAGAGTTGDTIGTTTIFVSTTTTTSPTAGFSSIATPSIAPGVFMEATGFMAAGREASPAASMDSPGHTASLVRIPVRLAVLIMEEWREASLRAGSLALAGASTEVEGSTEAVAVSMEEAVVTGNSGSFT